VIINLISYITERKFTCFSLSNVMNISRNLEAIKVPYNIVCMDRRITYA